MGPSNQPMPQQPQVPRQRMNPHQHSGPQEQWDSGYNNYPPPIIQGPPLQGGRKRDDFNQPPQNFGRIQPPQGPNIGPRGMNQAPQGPNIGPRGMNQAPQGPNIGPRGMNQAPQGQNFGQNRPPHDQNFRQQQQFPNSRHNPGYNSSVLPPDSSYQHGNQQVFDSHGRPPPPIPAKQNMNPSRRPKEPELVGKEQFGECMYVRWCNNHIQYIISSCIVHKHFQQLATVSY